MFTGIIETQGEIREIIRSGQNMIFKISCPKLPKFKLKQGDSISIDGTCFTIIKLYRNTFEVEAMPETLKLTVSARYQPKSKVNLETPLKTGAMLSGHFVTGHIDFVGRVVSISGQGNSKVIKIKFPLKYAKFIALKGSIAINGVSLTVSAKNSSSFSVSLIPFTINNSNLGRIKAGDSLNIEIDLISRYLNTLLKN